ncbi:hypothetical protein NESM_000143900 [Novymonas esmeraldas]|uniref:Proteophosphoglycan ppg4 n=1 Tax=Novymonas esmeraldas TaxID=1808958 RepID=A0AAW0F5B3_9TRYP
MSVSSVANGSITSITDSATGEEYLHGSPFQPAAVELRRIEHSSPRATLRSRFTRLDGMDFHGGGIVEDTNCTAPANCSPPRSSPVPMTASPQPRADVTSRQVAQPAPPAFSLTASAPAAPRQSAAAAAAKTAVPPVAPPSSLNATRTDAHVGQRTPAGCGTTASSHSQAAAAADHGERAPLKHAASAGAAPGKVSGRGSSGNAAPQRGGVDLTAKSVRGLYGSDVIVRRARVEEREDRGGETSTNGRRPGRRATMPTTSTSTGLATSQPCAEVQPGDAQPPPSAPVAPSVKHGAGEARAPPPCIANGRRRSVQALLQGQPADASPPTRDPSATPGATEPRPGGSRLVPMRDVRAALAPAPPRSASLSDARATSPSARGGQAAAAKQRTRVDLAGCGGHTPQREEPLSPLGGAVSELSDSARRRYYCTPELDEVTMPVFAREVGDVHVRSDRQSVLGSVFRAAAAAAAAGPRELPEGGVVAPAGRLQPLELLAPRRSSTDSLSHSLARPTPLRARGLSGAPSLLSDPCGRSASQTTPRSAQSSSTRSADAPRRSTQLSPLHTQSNGGHAVDTHKGGNVLPSLAQCSR